MPPRSRSPHRARRAEAAAGADAAADGRLVAWHAARAAGADAAADGRLVADAGARRDGGAGWSAWHAACAAAAARMTAGMLRATGAADARRRKKKKKKRRKKKGSGARSRGSSCSADAPSSTSSSFSPADGGVGAAWQLAAWQQAATASAWQQLAACHAQAWPGAGPPGASSSSSCAWPGGAGQSSAVPVYLDRGCEEWVPVPRSLIGRVIGRRGTTLQEIRDKSGAWKVDAREQSTDPCQVKVVGPAEAVARARQLIEEVVQPLGARHAGEAYVDISQGMIGRVIGDRGSEIARIEKNTGTKIDIDAQREPCRVYVLGPEANVRRAKEIIIEIAREW